MPSFFLFEYEAVLTSTCRDWPTEPMAKSHCAFFFGVMPFKMAPKMLLKVTVSALLSDWDLLCFFWGKSQAFLNVIWNLLTSALTIIHFCFPLVYSTYCIHYTLNCWVQSMLESIFLLFAILLFLLHFFPLPGWPSLY